MEKHCRTCNQTKAVTEFNKSAAKKDGLQSNCRECDNQRTREHYRSHKPYYIQKARMWTVDRRESNRKHLYAYLVGHPCVDCGESDIVVLHFDHQRDKSFEISKVLNYLPWDQILDEIEKCQVRCSNCHMKRTAEQFGWDKLSYFLTRGESVVD